MSAQRSDQSDFWQTVSIYSGLGFVFFGSIGGGYLLGWLVDRWLRTSPIFALILAGLGLAGGLIEILQILRRVEKRESGNGDGPPGN